MVMMDGSVLDSRPVGANYSGKEFRELDLGFRALQFHCVFEPGGDRTGHGLRARDHERGLAADAPVLGLACELREYPLRELAVLKRSGGLEPILLALTIFDDVQFAGRRPGRRVYRLP